MRKTVLWGAVLLATSCFDTGTLPDGGPIGGGGGGGGGFVDGGGTGFFGDGGPLCLPMTDPAPVVTLARPPSAIAGGTLARLADGTFLAADPDRARLVLVDSTLNTVRTVPLDAGDEPGRVIDGAGGHAYVVLRKANQILDLAVHALTFTRLETCQHPRGLAAQGSTLLVGCLDGTLERLDPATGARTRLPLDPAVTDLRDVVVDGQTVLVSTFRSAGLFSVAADGAVTPFTTPTVGAEPHVAWRTVGTPGGKTVMVRQLHSTAQLAPAQPCVSTYGGGGSIGGGTATGGGQALGASVVNTELVTIDTDGVASSELQFVAVPIDVAVSTTGSTAVLGVNAMLSMHRSTDGAIFGLSMRQVFDGEEQALAVVFAGEQVVVQMRDPAQLVVLDENNVLRRVALGGEPVSSTGHTLFHRVTSANLACASCHPEAGDDGHTWQFFDGPRRTPSLRGGLKGTEPFHWVGDLPTMDSLMTEVMVLRMGGQQETPAQTAALEDWLDAQPKLAPPAVDAAQVAAGKVAFDRACVSCHAGQQGTNNATVSVGTDGAFQVPRLTELAWRGPWFHDGRLTKLEDRFGGLAGGDQHGAVSTLSADEQRAVIDYLRTR